VCESLLSLLWKSRDLEAALPLVSVLQGGRLPSSHRCRKFPVLHRLIYGSCVTWRTRKVNSGDDDRLLVVRHPVDVTRSAFGQPQTRSAGSDTTEFLGQEVPRKEGENHENAEARRSAVCASVAAAVATNSARTIRGYAVSATSTSILPTLRLGHHRTKRTTGRRRH
jgi:hypothetical protein